MTTRQKVKHLRAENFRRKRERKYNEKCGMFSSNNTAKQKIDFGKLAAALPMIMMMKRMFRGKKA